VFKTVAFPVALTGCLLVLAMSVRAADSAPPTAESDPGYSAAHPVAAPSASTAKSTTDVVESTPKGQLKNPYKDSDAAAIEAGRKAYFKAGCNGCHGGNGGGGMCPPLTNDTWVYGGDDDTLFRLVTLGSDQLQSKGYTRKGHENVVGPMPPMGPIVGSADTLWQIFAFVRSNYNGAPECKFGCPPPAAEPKNP
jgi:mono/diheme cytochrome c family protein